MLCIMYKYDKKSVIGYTELYVRPTLNIPMYCIVNAYLTRYTVLYMHYYYGFSLVVVKAAPVLNVQ